MRVDRFLVLACWSVLTLCHLSATTAEAQSRTWSSASGKQKIEAEFLKATEDTVTIRRTKDGKEVTVPLKKLSTADQEFVATKLASDKAEAAVRIRIKRQIVKFYSILRKSDRKELSDVIAMTGTNNSSFDNLTGPDRNTSPSIRDVQVDGDSAVADVKVKMKGRRRSFSIALIKNSENWLLRSLTFEDDDGNLRRIDLATGQEVDGDSNPDSMIAASGSPDRAFERRGVPPPGDSALAGRDPHESRDGPPAGGRRGPLVVPNLTPPTAGQPVSFVRHVTPIVSTLCGRCHVRDKKGDLSFQSYVTLMKGTPEGPVLVPGEPDQSPFVTLLESGEMPPSGGTVGAEYTSILRDWVAQGAKFDGQDESASLNFLLASAQSGGQGGPQEMAGAPIGQLGSPPPANPPAMTTAADAGKKAGHHPTGHGPTGHPEASLPAPK